MIPAFPVHPGAYDPNRPMDAEGRLGMTQLDWFAGQALVGLISGGHLRQSGGEPHTTTSLATEAYKLARAMMIEGAKQ